MLNILKLKGNPQIINILFLFVILGFLLALVPLLPVSVIAMGTNVDFVFEVLPLPFWVGVCIITIATFLMIFQVSSKRTIVIFLISCIMLVVSFRMAFPIIFQSIPAFEPDSTGYMTTLSSWVNNGVDFGFDGDYRHNYPLSFLIGYAFIKLGVPLEAFFRIAPFFIYVLDLLLLYFITRLILPEDKKNSVLSVLPAFLFSFSSLGYWVTVHYCPDLFGSLMFLLSLFLTIRFAKMGDWKIKALIPVLLSIFLLILSHHLSILYFIVTLLGFALSVWFFKPKDFKNGALTFFLLAIYTYSLWFVYGTLIYPSFFNVYVYFSGFSSVSQQSAGAGLINNIAFGIYPVFILGLFLVEFFRVISIRNPISFIKGLRQNLHEIRVREVNNTLLVFFVGFILVIGLFIVGFGLPVLFGTRILEVVFLGLYPLAGESLLKLTQVNRKRKVIFCIILLIIVLSGLYRYYTQIQRRVILPSS